MGVTVTKSPMPRLLSGVGQLSGFKRGLMAAGLHLKGKMAIYPPRKRMAMGFVSAKQRKFFFWALRTGRIEVPYRRGLSPNSERLAQRWTAVQRGLSTIVGNNASYAPYVQGNRQSAYHKRVGWKTARDVLKAEKTRLLAIIVAELKK
jgi:hypothetical protein